MPVAGGPKITTTGILLEVDAANASSYTSGSSTWVNVFRPGTRNGTINGTLGFNQDDSKGALTFPGTASSYVDFGNIGDLSVSWSFQVAVKPAPSASGNYTILSYASGSNTGSWTYKLDYSSSNQSAVLSVYSATGSTQVVYRVTGSVPTGSWSIINASFGSSLIALNINGIPRAFTLTTGSTVGYNANNRLYLGGTFGTTSSFYTGSIGSFFSYTTDIPGAQLIQNYNAYATRFGLPPSVLNAIITDPDAYNFIDAAGITDTTQQSAINGLVVGLKGSSLWDKMVAIYPFVGGTAYTHKWNLKNTTLYTVDWFGAITHDSNGITLLNGGYGIVPSLNQNILEQNNASISVYNKTTLLWDTTNRFFVGGSVTLGVALGYITNGGGYNSSTFFSAGAVYRDNNVGSPGYLIMTRTNSSNYVVYRNSTLLQTLNETSTTPPSSLFQIGRNGTTGNVTTQTSALITVGQGLSQSEVTTLTNLVQAFQTTLGRQA